MDNVGRLKITYSVIQLSDTDEWGYSVVKTIASEFTTELDALIYIADELDGFGSLIVVKAVNKNWVGGKQ